jgi:hypothetical protein
MGQCARPSDLKFLLKPVQTYVGKVRDFKNRDPKLNNHVQTVADGFNIFPWVSAAVTDYTSHGLLIDLLGWSTRVP